MNNLELHDGTVVTSVGHLEVNGKVHFIIKLPSPKVINEQLVTMVLYPLHYFKNTFQEGIF